MSSSLPTPQHQAARPPQPRSIELRFLDEKDAQPHRVIATEVYSGEAVVVTVDGALFKGSFQITYTAALALVAALARLGGTLTWRASGT